MDGFVYGKIIYVLDFIQLLPYELESCDFGCRRLLGNNFLTEKNVLKKSNAMGNWSFELLGPAVTCTKEKIEQFMSEPTPYDLDGLMFYYAEVRVF